MLFSSAAVWHPCKKTTLLQWEVWEEDLDVLRDVPTKDLRELSKYEWVEYFELNFSSIASCNVSVASQWSVKSGGRWTKK